MSYFKAKKDLALVISFKPAVHQFWELEERAKQTLRAQGPGFDMATPTQQRRTIRQEAAQLAGYSEARGTVARGTRRVIDLCYFHKIPIQGTSYPPGYLPNSPPVPVNYIMAILEDTSWCQLDTQVIDDRLNQLIGKCEEWVEITWRRLLNPLWWIYEALSFTLRIPFRLIEMTGFNVRKIEGHLIGKTLLLLELIGLLIYFGASYDEIRDFIKGFPGKK